MFQIELSGAFYNVSGAIFTRFFLLSLSLCFMPFPRVRIVFYPYLTQFQSVKFGKLQAQQVNSDCQNFQSGLRRLVNLKNSKQGDFALHL